MAEATQAQIRAEELVKKLWLDGEIGAKLRKSAKEAFPDMPPLPDEQAEPFVAPLRAQNEALQKRLEKLEEDRAAEKVEREKNATQATFEQAIAAARTSYSLTDEGFDKMIARMKETGNYSDADAAAAWVASKTPPAAVPGPTWAPQDLNLYGSKNPEEEMAKLHRDPIGYQDSQLAEFFKNPDKYVQETFGA